MSEGKDRVNISELRAVLAAGEGCTLVDVREYPEFAAGRVAGAQLIPLGELERRASELDPGTPIYVICRTGRRSSEAQRLLRAAGFADVRNVEGGVTAWMAAGFPVERTERAPWSLERQVRFVAGLLVLAGVLLSVLVAPAFVWLSAFVGAGLVFAAVTDTCAMGLALARLPWNRMRPADLATCPAEQAGQGR